MADNDPPRRSKGAKAQNLLNRFPVTDLAQAVARKGERRRRFLEHVVESWPNGSYVPTRQSYHMIYGASSPLIQIPPEPWEEVEKNLKSLCDPDILAMNMSASRELFDLVRSREYSATTCDEQVLRVGFNQIVPIGLTFYVTEGDRLLFQFPQPRMDALTFEEILVLGSVIHYAYAQGDYANAVIEVADLSDPNPPVKGKPRKRDGRICCLAREEIMGRELLTEQIDDVYAILKELVSKTPHK
jgi:hypothetical protein